MTSPQPLTCTCAIVDAHTARIVVSGDIVFDSGDELLRAVTELLEDHPVRRLRLDCGEVTFCDSYGLGTLLAVHRRVAAAGGELHLENRPPTLERLMRRTNTYQHLAPSAEPEREHRVDS
ncbi:STAS domain-containing protein [Saccharothrix algeriensis]|uniref:Anti-anti-sigma factor n=1 Tax=Saccharothrix algeriensis TaxID=173560 RepID=A0A8T8HYI6_9PSEU|nr:STAS domain-containing protein [Saccharothrix algeriensis]MBM7809323.1 anti-anti-sigma factor [Saccharothrix algeriensis]QTR03665.1 STAS domain-containing protein [Saccharothrix algeriensis]